MTATATAPASTGADAALAGVAGPAAHGLHGPGGLGRLARGGRGRRAASCRRRCPRRAAASMRVGRRDQRVEQGLVAEVGPAAGLDALDRGAQHRDDLGRRPARLSPPAVVPARRNAVPQIGPEVPPIRLVMTTAIFFRKVPMSVRSKPSQSAQHDLEAAGHRVAEVAVADHRVQVAEVLLVVHRGLRDRAHDELDVGEAGRAIGLLLGRSPCRDRAQARCSWLQDAGQVVRVTRRPGWPGCGWPARWSARRRVAERGDDQRGLGEVLVLGVVVDGDRAQAARRRSRPAGRCGSPRPRPPGRRAARARRGRAGRCPGPASCAARCRRRRPRRRGPAPARPRAPARPAPTARPRWRRRRAASPPRGLGDDPGDARARRAAARRRPAPV